MEMNQNRILVGDARICLPSVPDCTANNVVTSPPYYGLRDYGHKGQIGLEPNLEGYVNGLFDVLGECWRILRDDGTLWLNLGDSYSGGNRGNYDVVSSNKGNAASRGLGRPSLENLKPKDLIGVPWTVAFLLRDAGWYLRSAIVWAKPNTMPGSQEDRCTSSYEMIFMLSKSASYWSDFDAIKTPPSESTLIRTAQDRQAQAGSHRANGGGKTNGAMKAVTGKQRGHSRQHAGFNDRWDKMEKAEQCSAPAMMRDVWFVSPGGSVENHFAMMPNEIARRCILAGCPEGGTVLDPFMGAGTTGLVARRYGRNYLGCELNPDYAALAQRRILKDQPLFGECELLAAA